MRLGLPGMPAAAEDIMVARVRIRLAEITGLAGSTSSTSRPRVRSSWCRGCGASA